MSTIYIAGPMRGIAEFNFPEFDRAADFLWHNGHHVVNPAEHDRDGGFDAKGMTGHEDLTAYGFDLREALQWDLREVAAADGVAVLPGWEKSSGARAEVALAHALGVPVASVEQWSFPEAVREYVKAEAPRSDNAKPKTQIVGLNGFARSGKDTAAQGLAVHGFTQLALADPIRQSMLTLNPLLPSGQRFSEVVEYHLGDWNACKADPEDGGEFRKLMQRFGTEVGRELLRDNVWIDLLAKRMEGFKRVAVSDVRFPNEAEWVLSQGGVVIEVVRPGVGAANGHASEKPLPRHLVTHTIHNNGTIEDLHRKVARAALAAS
jgi:hypothetical protein